MKPLVFRRLSLSVLLLLPLLPFAGCSTLQQISQMVNLSQCQFRLASVDTVSISGIPIQGGISVSDINPLDLIKLQSAYSSGTLPLQFTLNLEAKNPNSSPAGMNRMEWILLMDGSQLTTGVLEKEVDIPASGGVGTFPLVVNLDLLQVLSGRTLNSMINLALNIAGEGTKPTHVALKIKPSINVAGQTLDYPGYVTINHDFSSN